MLRVAKHYDSGHQPSKWESWAQRPGSVSKPVHLKGNQSWIFTGRTDAEAEVPVLWPPDVKSKLTGKDPDAGKDWGQEEKGATEDEIVGWHHRLNRHEFEETLGDSAGQGSPVCCSWWVWKSWTRLSDWAATKGWPQSLSSPFPSMWTFYMTENTRSSQTLRELKRMSWATEMTSFNP